MSQAVDPPEQRADTRFGRTNVAAVEGCWRMVLWMTQGAGYQALGDSDARLTQLYGLMRKEFNNEVRDKLRVRQLNWIRQRDLELLGRCLPGDSLQVACGVSLYEQRIYELLLHGEKAWLSRN